MSKFSIIRKLHHYLSVPRIAALLIVGIIALGAVYFNQHSTVSLHAINVSTTTTATSTSTFPIPELGIQLTLPSGLTPSDLQYYAQINRPVTAADPHPWSTVSFSTKSLLQMDSACTADEGSIGIIGRLSEDPKAIKAEVRESLPLGNYYFAFAAPQGSCTMNPKAQQLASTQIGLLQQAFETVKAGN